MDTTALMQSLVLTAVGMLVVFVFMGLLILVVKLFLVVTFRFFPDAEEESSPPSSRDAVTAAKGDEKLAAAIAVALASKNREK